MNTVPNSAQLPPLVDVHSHVYPREMIEQYKLRTEMPRIEGDYGGERFLMFESEQNRVENGRAMVERFWSMQDKLAFMDLHGMSHSVVTIGNPWLSPFGADVAGPLARTLNTWLSELEANSQGRLVGMGVLPEDSPESAIAELARLADARLVRGVAIGSQLAGRQLDDKALTDMWRIANESGLVVMLHPHYGLASEDMQGYGRRLSGSLGFTFETTLALARLAFAGVFDRFSDVRIVAAHGGGTLPFIMDRIDAGWLSDPEGAISVPPSEYLSRIYLDGLVFGQRALRAAIDLVGADHVMFGTDHPYRTDPISNIEAVRQLPEDEREDVAHGTAERLFQLT